MYFVEVYSEIGAGKHGTNQGVALMSNHCRRTYSDVPVSKIHQAGASSIAHPKAKYIESLTPFFANELMPTIQDRLLLAQTAGQFPVILSGDHANAAAAIAAFCNHHRHQKTGVVWIDAHADLHTVYTTPSGNMHGMPLAAALGLDNQDCQINEVDTPVAHYWQTLKDLNNNRPSPCDVFFLGLRSFEPPEAHLLKQHEMFAYSAIEHRKAGIGQVLDQLVALLGALDAVYVSFDVDALDNSLIFATGTPEADGYRCEEVRMIFERLLSLPMVKLFEVTEFNPSLNDSSTQAQMVLGLLDEALAIIAQR